MIGLVRKKINQKLESLPNVVVYTMTANADKQNVIISILVLLTFLTGTKKCKTRMSVIPGGKLQHLIKATEKKKKSSGETFNVSQTHGEESHH